MNSPYNQLLKNIHAFVRKYYLNSLIRGGLYTLSITISFYLIFVLLEYFFYLGKPVKITILSVYIVLTGATFIGFIFIPLLRLTNILPQLSMEEASKLIGNHFPDIRDKLLNTIQLFKTKSSIDEQSLRILNASIEQKSLKIGVFNFKQAINFSINKKYIKYAIPPVAIVVLLLFSAPSVIINPTERLLLYDSTFVPKAPFKFVLINDKLTAEEGQNYTIKLLLKGETVPEDVVLNMDGFEYIMQKDSKVNYHFRIKNLKKELSFYFKADKYRSKEYVIKLFNTPKISRVLINAVYPAYIHRKQETIQNLSDLIMPEGTKLSFSIHTKDVSSLKGFNQENKIVPFVEKPTGVYSFTSKVLLKNSEYQFVAKNKFVNNQDTLTYHIQIIKDEYPRIKAEEYQDTIFDKRRYFKGFIKDDYGFSKLFFELKFTTNSGSDTLIRTNIPIVKSIQSQEFLHFINIKDINYLPGSIINYSFVIYDNDGVNGAKMSRTQLFTYTTKTQSEEEKESNKRDEALNKSMGANIHRANELNKKIKALSEKLKGKKTLSWQEKKEINDVLEQYKELQKKIEEAKAEKKLNDVKNAELEQPDDELLKKQEELNKLMEEIMTPEMKELMEKLQKMMEENAKKEDVDKALEQMKMDSEFLKEQLERELEIMKQMKFDLKFQQAIDKIDELQKRQEELSALTENKKENTEKLKQQQDSLNKEFDNFKKMMEETRKANQALEKPNPLQDTQQKENEISQEMQESSNKLNKGKKKSAANQQKSASSKMKSLKEEMEQMQASMESQSNAEDMENLKSIMENLIEISFNQEQLMHQVKHTSNRDPKFPEYVEAQKRISRDLSMVEDSLMKLAKRNPSISPYINKEIQKIQNYSERTFVELKELNTIAPSSSRALTQTSGNQQFIMTSVNNLALMLSEVLDQMKKQQMQKSGKGNCKKPKPGSGKGMKSMRQMQQALQKQMEQMQKQMQQQGKNKGKGSKGNKSQNGEKISEEFAKMAAQQEAIRKKLQQYSKRMAKEGRGKEAGEINKIAQEMEKNETDLVNKIITAESLLRQKEILTRLLESEKAEQEREQKEERESKEGKTQKKGNKNLIFQYKKSRSEDMELLRTIPPELQPFYKKLVDSYFSK